MSATHPALRADVSCRLLEVDFSAIEAVLSGWYLNRHAIDPEGARLYVRMARLGIHAGVAAMAAGDPVDWTKPDADVREHLKRIKHDHPELYDPCKRVVHGNNFGLTTHGMVEKFARFFPTLKVAEKFQNFYYALAPGLPAWHVALRRRAREIGMLGGPTPPGGQEDIWTHPYGYRHAFWDVLSYRPINEFDARKWQRDPKRAWRVTQMHGRWFSASYGGDANRVIAFYPQSTAAGRLKEAQLDLFLPDSPDYIGDAYFGRTPLLVPIHDSLLLHVPNRAWDRVYEKVIRVMQTPSTYLPVPMDWGMGPFLPIGVSAKAGRNWAPKISDDEAAYFKVRANYHGMEELPVPVWAFQEPDAPVLPREGEGELDDWRALERTVA